MGVRIVGIDPGLQVTGYGCVVLDATRGMTSEPTLVEAGVIKLKRGATMASRLVQLHEDLQALFAELSPSVIVVEKLFSHYRHARTSILMGHARGVVLLAAEQQGAEIDELAATEVKKALCGNGHATKRQMQLSIMQQCRLPEPPEPHDVADAIAIALCAARRLTTAAVDDRHASSAAR